jgi:hypothetical protein
MKPRRHSVRPQLETLEGREVPAGNLTVSFSAATHTLTVIGDDGYNDVGFLAAGTDPTRFILASSGTINDSEISYISPTGVENIVIKMLDGDDYVTFQDTGPMAIQGNLTIDGGDGANYLLTSDLSVQKNLTITNGMNPVGFDQTRLCDVSVGGNVTIANGDGDTVTQIFRPSTAGQSTIAGNLRVTNGTGQDSFLLRDTNVGRNVTINNGHGRGGRAGALDISNNWNTTVRSVIGGSLTVTDRDGDVSPYGRIGDLEVIGNAALNYGSGKATTLVDGFATALPVLVRGNVTLTGSGANTVSVGAGWGRLTGLVVGKNFTMTSAAGDDTINLANLQVGVNCSLSLGDGSDSVYLTGVQVGGNCTLSLGEGNNYVSLNDSNFAHRFTLATGSGNDTAAIEASAGSSSSSEFGGAVKISLGNGLDSCHFAGIADAKEEIVALGTFVVSSVEFWTEAPSHVVFPFQGRIRFQ